MTIDVKTVLLMNKSLNLYQHHETSFDGKPELELLMPAPTFAAAMISIANLIAADHVFQLPEHYQSKHNETFHAYAGHNLLIHACDVEINQAHIIAATMCKLDARAKTVFEVLGHMALTPAPNHTLDTTKLIDQGLPIALRRALSVVDARGLVIPHREAIEILITALQSPGVLLLDD